MKRLINISVGHGDYRRVNTYQCSGCSQTTNQEGMFLRKRLGRVGFRRFSTAAEKSADEKAEEVMACCVLAVNVTVCFRLAR